MNIVQSGLKSDILTRQLPIKRKAEINVNTGFNTKSYSTRRLEGESTIDLLNEYLGSFQLRKIKTENSLKYFIERCIKNEEKVKNIRDLYSLPNKYFISINSVDIILKDIIDIKYKFGAELKKRCVTRKEYRERISVIYKLIGEFIEITNNVDILEKIFLENTN